MSRSVQGVIGAIGFTGCTGPTGPTGILGYGPSGMNGPIWPTDPKFVPETCFTCHGVGSSYTFQWKDVWSSGPELRRERVCRECQGYNYWIHCVFCEGNFSPYSSLHFPFPELRDRLNPHAFICLRCVSGIWKTQRDFFATVPRYLLSTDMIDTIAGYIS